MKTTFLGKALQFAYTKHAGQVDDNGENYVNAHIIPVVRMLKEVTKDEKILASAYLHDTLEDTNTTLEELEKEFGKEVAGLVYEMTHEGKKDEIGFYFPRLHSKEAIMVKLADRLSNISRMQSWSENRQAQYLRKSKFWKSSENNK